MSKTILITLISISFQLFCGCAVNPVTGKQQLMFISPAQELQIGRQYAPEVEKQLGGAIDNAVFQNYINSIGRQIAAVSHTPQLEFHYTAVNDTGINAMALPGGYVFITRGMLESLTTEAQLAAILAHETVHVTARHAAQAMSNQIGMEILLSAVTSDTTSQSVVTVARLGSQIIGLKHSRENETEADTIGLDYLVNAGYHPNAMVEIIEMLERQNQLRPIEFLSTHPSPANRRENIIKYINARGYLTAGKTGRAEYEKNVLEQLNN